MSNKTEVTVWMRRPFQPKNIKEKFLISFSNYKKNIDNYHGD